MKPEPEDDIDEVILMWRMVSAMQIDLAAAIRSDGLEVETLSKMMRNCAGCVDPHMCKVFLTRREDLLPRPPKFCPNKMTLRSLRINHHVDLH